MKSKNTNRVIADFPDYTVNELGNVYGKNGDELKHDITHDGYHRVTLYSNGKSKHYPIHRLVAETYIPNPYNKPTVNHIDGNKSNNSVGNLEWCTRSENSQHAYDNDLHRCHFTKEDRFRGGQTRAEATRRSVKVIETGVIYASTHECARKNGLVHGNISACCNGNRKSHRGLHFEWV